MWAKIKNTTGSKAMKKFAYSLDRRAQITTVVVVTVIVVATVLITVFTLGSYIPVWFLSMVGAIVGLCVLSIPRSVRITGDALEISCVVELTQIPFDHIKSVRKMDKTELRSYFPVFASYGFFGYFGYFINLHTWDTVKMYATRRENLVLIEDIYEQSYIVNVDRPDRLLTEVKTMRALFQKPI